MAKTMWNPGGVSGDVAVGLTAAGTTQGTATVMTADNVSVTTSTGAANGVLMKIGNESENISLVVSGSAAYGVNWYPPSGMQLNYATANLPLYVPPGRAAIAKFLNNTHILVIAGA